MFFFFQAEDGIRGAHLVLEFRRLLFRSVEPKAATPMMTPRRKRIARLGRARISSVSGSNLAVGTDASCWTLSAAASVTIPSVTALQIGRARGRERVVQYGWIPWLPVS